MFKCASETGADEARATGNQYPHRASELGIHHRDVLGSKPPGRIFFGYLLKIALLTTDNREHQRTYGETMPRFGPAIEALLEGLATISELEIHVIACTQRPMHVPEKLSENTWFHLLHVPKIGWLRTGYQGCVRAVRRQLGNLQPDLVHGQGTERECALAAALSGFPNVVTIHGNMSAVAKSMGARVGSYLWCAAALESFALRRAGGVFCNSAYTEQLVRRHNATTWRVPNALRLGFFETPIPSRPPSSKPVLLNIGAIVPYKRQLNLLDLTAKLHHEGHLFTTYFIGRANPETSYGRAFLKRFSEIEPSGLVHNLPPQALPDLITTFDAASALVHIPSEEAFGLVAAEGLTRNLKFFGTRIGGLTDIADEVEDAELFELRDTNALRSAIVRWFENGCRQPKTAAQEMRVRYHPAVIARQHLEIYQRLVSTAPPPSRIPEDA